MPSNISSWCRGWREYNRCLLTHQAEKPPALKTSGWWHCGYRAGLDSSRLIRFAPVRWPLSCTYGLCWEEIPNATSSGCVHLPPQAAVKGTHPQESLVCRLCKGRRPPSVAKLCCWAVSDRRQVGRCPMGPFREFAQVRRNSSWTCSPAPTCQSPSHMTQQNWLDLGGKMPPNTMDP